MNQDLTNSTSLRGMVSNFIQNHLHLSFENNTLHSSALGDTIGYLEKLNAKHFFSFGWLDFQSRALTLLGQVTNFSMYEIDQLLSSKILHDSKTINISALSADISTFNSKLWKNVALYNSTPQNITLNALQSNLKSIDLMVYFKAFTKPEYLGSKLNGSTVVLADLDYFKRLDSILLETKVDIIRAYLTLYVFYVLGLIHSRCYYVSSKSYRQNERIMSGVDLTDTSYSNKLKCSALTLDYFDKILSRLFVLSFFDSSRLHEVEMLVQSIKGALRKRILSLEWLDETTKKSAIVKLDKMTSHIGIPDYFDDMVGIKKDYAGLQMEPSHFYENLESLRMDLHDKMMKFVFEKEDLPIWMFPASYSNAFNFILKNRIIIPAGILQTPFFHPENPAYLNFGSLGYIIAHEMTHAFDSTGALLDESGNRRKWWSESSFNQFTHLSKCMVDQYQNYTMEFGNKTLSVNGNNTLDENIADNGGLENAYRAWKSYSSNPEQLPGLTETPEQLFFISFAQTWCHIENPTDEYLILKDTHSPDHIRVKGILSNSFVFASAFQCESNTPMNPDKKCTIWKK